jgi:hypothetical protein
MARMIADETIREIGEIRGSFSLVAARIENLPSCGTMTAEGSP